VRGGASEKLTDVLQRELDSAGLTMRGDAARVVLAHLGDDGGRIAALVDLWASTFGPGANLEVDDVTPYLNEVGSVRPFELTNRIEEGDVAGSLEVLYRLLTVPSPNQPKPMHPLQVLGILNSRYRTLARLDTDAVVTVDDAHEVLESNKKNRGRSKSTYPAKKALEATRALGPDGFGRAFGELHRADVGIKGATGLPEDAVLEIAVARLANLHRGGGRSRARR
jgi:DNA polymerase-3 subunit delta